MSTSKNGCSPLLGEIYDEHSIDSIFEEIESLYDCSPVQELKIINIGASSGDDVLDKKRALVKLRCGNKNAKFDEYKIVTEGGTVPPLVDFALAIENAMRAISEDQQAQQNETDEKKKKKLSPEEEKRLRERQIEIARRLREESEQIRKDSQDREKMLQIARDPKAYAMQHQASVGVIPREQRQAFIAQPVPTQQQMQQMSQQQMTPEQMQQYRAMQQQMQHPQQASMVKAAGAAVMGATQKTYGFMMMGMMLMNLAGYATGLFGWLWDAITGFAGVKYAKHTTVNNTVTINKDGSYSFTGIADQFLQNIKNKFVPSSAKGALVIDNEIVCDDITDKAKMNAAMLKDNGAGKLVPRYPEGTNASVLIPEGSGAKFADGQKWDPSKYTHSPWMLSLSNGVMYIGIAAIIAAVAYIIYKWLFRKVDKSKKQQLAQQRNVNVQEITVPMLCEANELDAAYYADIQAIDEGLVDWFKSILPTPRNLARWLDGGIAIMNGLSRTTEEGLKNGSVNGFLGAGTNILVGIGNLVLITAKSILLGISALFRK